MTRDRAPRRVLEVSADGSEKGRITVRVVKSPPPSLAPIRIADMRAGEKRTIDLARYLRPGVSNAEPTVVRAEQITGLDVRIGRSGDSGVTITTGDRVDGRAEFRIVMSDVSGRTGPERQVEGRIALDVLDVPDQPRAPVPGRTVRSQEVHLEWRAPAANGAPITAYELRAGNGSVRRCGSTSCDFTGLTNGKNYTFTVRAQNAVGWSEWSPRSAQATPDARPGTVGPIEMVSRGDRTLTLKWTPPTTQTSAIERYYVTWPGGSLSPTSPRAVVRGLDNNKQYVFSVQAENALDLGPLRNSPPFQSIGTPAAPAPPRRDAHRPGGGHHRRDRVLARGRPAERSRAGALHRAARREPAAGLHRHPGHPVREHRHRLRRHRLPLRRQGHQRQRCGQERDRARQDLERGRPAGAVGRLVRAAHRAPTTRAGRPSPARRRAARPRASTC